MKKFFPLFAVVTLLITLASCECTECHKFPEPSQKICRSDYPDRHSYQDAIVYWRQQYYDCD